jgi:hypothetical protein
MTPLSPSLPEGRPLELSDRTAIDDALGQTGFVPSEYCFANLFLFRHRHRYRICHEPVAHIRGVTYDGEAHALPLVGLDRSTADALLASGVTCLYPFAPEIEALAAGLGLSTSFNAADSDYWYDATQLATLTEAGDRRRQASAFEDAWAPTIEQWSDAAGYAAMAVLNGWLDDVGRERDATDFAECEEAIALMQELSLEGRLVRIGSGEPVAFLIVGARADDVRVVHFAKGRRVFSNAYPWMFSRYAGEEGVRWCNFEQDLGNPGLAQSKRAYGPSEIRPKLRLRPQGRVDPLQGSGEKARP